MPIKVNKNKINYMPNLSYSDKLKDPRWQKRRLQVLNKAKWKCHLCGDAGTNLQVHHKKYTNEPWDAPASDLSAICEDCHKITHEFHLSPGQRGRKDKDVIFRVIKMPKEMDWYKPVFVFTNNGIRCMFVFMNENEVHLQYTLPNEALELLYKKRPRNIKPNKKAA